jgi:hypothetical protein
MDLCSTDGKETLLMVGYHSPRRRPGNAALVSILILFFQRSALGSGAIHEKNLTDSVHFHAEFKNKCTFAKLPHMVYF